MATVATLPASTAALIAKARTLLDRIARRLALPWRLRLTPAGARRLTHAIGDAAATAMVRSAKAFAKAFDPTKPIMAAAVRWAADCVALLAPHHLAGAWAALRGTPTAANGLPPDGVPGDATLREVGEAVAAQRGYFARFAAAVAGGKLQPIKGELPSGRFVARAALYGWAVWGTAERVRRAAAIAAGLPQERRVLGSTRRKPPCGDCRDEADRGWVPMGTLRPIGDSVCQVRCRCYFQYS